METNEENPNKTELDVVYDEDLLPVLEKLGVKKDFIENKIKCCFCSQPVTQENLYSFFLEGSDLKMVCDNKNCTEKLKKK